MIRKLALICLTLLGLTAAYGATFNGDAMTLKQPDGSTVAVKLFGTEHFMRGESPDGYTLIVDPATNWICYAREDADGQLVSSGIPYSDTHVGEMRGSMVSRRAQSIQSRIQQLRIEKNLRYTKSQRDEIIRKVKSQISPAPGDSTSGGTQPAVQAAAATTGTIYQLAILIDFPDRPANIALNSVRDAYNASTYNDPRSSVKTWSSTMSNNMVSLETYVIGYYRAKYSTSHYLRGTTFDYSAATELRNEVLPWADSQFNFSELTTSGGVVKSINFLYAGDVISNGWANSLWPHASSYAYRTQDGVSTGAYFMSNLGNSTPLTGMKTIRHELGHNVFGWPDTYDYDGDSYSGGGFAMETDIPCAPFRAKHGWITVVNINNQSRDYSLPENANTVLRYDNPNNGNEYFMIEYVRKQGWRANAPDEGLLIWHVDEAGNNSHQDMTQTRHYAHSVEQADGLFELERNTRNGSDGDLFHGGYRTLFDNTTTPNSSWWNGSGSGLKISNIGNKGGTTMTLTVGSGGGGGGGDNGGGTSGNLAPSASLSVSSEYSSAYGKAKLVDGIKGVHNSGEWASRGETKPWAQLNWSQAVTVDKVVLYDRANANDRISAATLLFSDGSSKAVGSLPNDGSAHTVTFTSRSITWVKLRVDDGAGPNVGLSEIEVFGNSGGGGGGGGDSTSDLPTITSPAPGSTLSSTSATFQWTAVTGADQYDLVISNANGGSYGDLRGSSPQSGTSAQVSNLPSDGRQIKATLWRRKGGEWKSADYLFTATTASAQNYVINGSFENGMASWSSDFDVGADYHQTTHRYDGNYNLAHYSTYNYEVMTYQTVANLPNGTYKATVYAKSTGGQDACAFYVYGFNAADWNQSKVVDLKAMSSYQKLEIRDIQVTNGQCTLSVYSKSPRYKWATFDKFELVRQ